MKWIVILLSMITLFGCSFAPKYQRPAMDVPTNYKETGKWLRAKPSSAALNRGLWWTMYGDPVLNELEAQVICANQNLRAAFERYEEAHAILAAQRAALYPSAVGVFNAFRQQASLDTANSPSSPLYNDKILSATFAYEVDLWGRVRNSIANAKSLERASAADLAALDVSTHAELANDYFALRGADAAQRVLDKTVTNYEKSLYLIRKRYQGGAAPEADYDQSINQLNTAKTMAADNHLKRAQLEHAIAVLIGKPPVALTLKPNMPIAKLVTISPELPSTLLERRPDVAAAEFKVQAANYNIGVARAAFFPAFNLAATIGYESTVFNNLFTRPSLLWAAGPTTASALLNNGTMPLLTQTIFDGGKLLALSKLAYAQYLETAANYRQTVLTAYQEVEDSLVAVRQLDRENQTQTIATQAADRAAQQAMYRYVGGLVTYIDVVVVQNIALQADLSKIDIRTRRQIASVQLIKALGGGIHLNKEG